MVQIVEGRPSGISQFFERAQPGVDALERYFERRRGEKERAEEDVALKEKGFDVTGVKDPRARQLLLESGIKTKKGEADIAADKERQSIISKYFGPDMAELYGQLTDGGKTKMTDVMLDAKLRGLDLREVIGKFIAENPEAIQTEPSAPQPIATAPVPEEVPIPQMKEGKLPKDFKIPDYTKAPPGYTQKDWAKSRGEWRKENAPIFKEITDQSRRLASDIRETKNLTRLNETRKVGEGFQGALINPLTGEFYAPAQALGLVSEEGQEWIKSIARFQNRAKDAFGSRVTNFDLQSYMRQFPTLLNTYEGRKRILEMMETNYELDDLYNSALKQIYEKAGLGNIPQEEAERLAEQSIREETERLENKFLKLDQENRSSAASDSAEGKRKSLEDIFG